MKTLVNTRVLWRSEFEFVSSFFELLVLVFTWGKKKDTHFLSCLSSKNIGVVLK